MDWKVCKDLKDALESFNFKTATIVPINSSSIVNNRPFYVYYIDTILLNKHINKAYHRIEICTPYYS